MDDACIRLTREILQSEGNPLFKKPRLTDTLLRRPPFRFLHDIISAIQRKTGFAQNFFSDAEANAKTLNREGKIAYLQKLIDVLDVEVDPAKVVAGLEPERTNRLLQALGRAAKGEKEVTTPPSKRPPSRRQPTERTNAPLDQEAVPSFEDQPRLTPTVMPQSDDREHPLPPEIPLGDVQSLSEKQSSGQLDTSTTLDLSRLELEASPGPGDTLSVDRRPPSRRHPSERPIESDSAENVFNPNQSNDPQADSRLMEANEVVLRDNPSLADGRPPSRRSSSERQERATPQAIDNATTQSTVDILNLDDASQTTQSRDILSMDVSPAMVFDGAVTGNDRRETMVSEDRQDVMEPLSSRCSSRPQTARKPPPSQCATRRPISSRGRSPGLHLTPPPIASSESETECEIETWSESAPWMPESEGALVRDLRREAIVDDQDVEASKTAGSPENCVNVESIGITVERLTVLLDGLRRCLEHLSNASEAAEKERQYWQREACLCREKLNEHTTQLPVTEEGHLNDLDNDVLITQSRIRHLKDSNNSRDRMIQQMLKSLTE